MTESKIGSSETVVNQTGEKWRGNRRDFLRVSFELAALAILGGCNQGSPRPNSPKTVPTAAPATVPSVTPEAPIPHPAAPPVPTSAPTKELIPEGMGLITINREKAEFERNGKRLRCVGFNRYDLLTLSPGDQDAIFASAAAMGGKILRFWCPASLTDNGNDTSKVASLIDAAKKNGMYLYPVFIDHWGTYNGQKQLGKDWYQGGYRTGGYREYVQKMVTSFRGVPQIGIWELVNEPQTTNADDLQAFARNMYDLIQVIDPGRPVSLGTIGTGQPGAQQQSWLTDTEAVNVASMHDDKNTAVTEDFGGQDNNFQTRIRQAKQNGLPMVVGELGIDADCKGGDPCLDPQDRAKAVAAKLASYINAGADMVLGWSVGLRDFGYDFTPADPSAAVWKQVSQQLES